MKKRRIIVGRALPEDLFFVGQLNFLHEPNHRYVDRIDLVSKILVLDNRGRGVLRVFMHRDFEKLPEGVHNVVVLKKQTYSFGLAVPRDNYFMAPENLDLSSQVFLKESRTGEPVRGNGEGESLSPEADLPLRDNLLLLKKNFPVADMMDLQVLTKRRDWPEVRARILSLYPAKAITSEMITWFMRLLLNAHSLRLLVQEIPETPVFKKEDSAEIPTANGNK